MLRLWNFVITPILRFPFSSTFIAVLGIAFLLDYLFWQDYTFFAVLDYLIVALVLALMVKMSARKIFTDEVKLFVVRLFLFSLSGGILLFIFLMSISLDHTEANILMNLSLLGVVFVLLAFSSRYEIRDYSGGLIDREEKRLLTFGERIDLNIWDIQWMTEEAYFASTRYQPIHLRFNAGKIGDYALAVRLTDIDIDIFLNNDMPALMLDDKPKLSIWRITPAFTMIFDEYKQQMESLGVDELENLLFDKSKILPSLKEYGILDFEVEVIL